MVHRVNAKQACILARATPSEVSPRATRQARGSLHDIASQSYEMCGLDTALDTSSTCTSGHSYMKHDPEFQSACSGVSCPHGMKTIWLSDARTHLQPGSRRDILQLLCMTSCKSPQGSVRSTLRLCIHFGGPLPAINPQLMQSFSSPISYFESPRA